MLDAAGLGRAVFSDVDPNPNETNMAAGIAVYLAGGHDGVICFGGGSALDLGKMIALMAHQQGSAVWELEDIDDWWTRADASKIAPIIAVPTTAGTGSEVGRAGVLTNSETHKKKIIFHPKLLPAVTICDPALTVGMPQFITAGTGMDALAHCLEAYCSPFYHPMSQGIALEGMRLVFENLPKVYANPNDLDARAHMMSAAAMGAVAFQKGLGAIHSLSPPDRRGLRHPPRHDQRRGHADGAGLQPRGHRGPDRARGGLSGHQGRLRGLPRGGHGPARRAGDPGEPDGDWAWNLRDLDMLTEMALEDPSCGGNPVEMTRENTRALFEACM